MLVDHTKIRHTTCMHSHTEKNHFRCTDRGVRTRVRSHNSFFFQKIYLRSHNSVSRKNDRKACCLGRRQAGE